MSFEHNAKDGTRNDGVNTSTLKNDREHVLPPRRTEFKEVILGRNCWMKRSSMMYGRDRRCRLMTVRSLANGRDASSSHEEGTDEL